MLWLCGRQVDGHPAMADAPAERPDAARHAVFRVDRHAMLVSPKPQHRPRKKLGKLLGLLRIPIVVARVVLVVRQQDNSARIVVARLHDLAKPVDLLGTKSAGRLDDVFHQRPADRTVAGVQADDAPMVVFEAKKACLLTLRLTIGYQTEFRKHSIEIGVAAGVHFMVAVQGKAAVRSIRPKARSVVIPGILMPRKFSSTSS